MKQESYWDDNEPELYAIVTLKSIFKYIKYLLRK